MTTFLIRRLLWMIPTLLMVALVTFIIMRNAPGGPWDVDADRRQVDAATQKSLNAYYGLDKPLWRQFIAYTIGDVNKKGVVHLRGDLRQPRPVLSHARAHGPGYPVLAAGRTNPSGTAGSAIRCAWD